MPMALLKMVEETEEEVHRAEKIASILPQEKKVWLDLAERGKQHAETLKEYFNELKKTIEIASPSELEKIIDLWLRTMVTETTELK